MEQFTGALLERQHIRWAHDSCVPFYHAATLQCPRQSSHSLWWGSAPNFLLNFGGVGQAGDIEAWASSRGVPFFSVILRLTP